MTDLLAAAAGAAAVFAATNIDDIVVLTVFFVAARHAGRPHPWHIVAGQYPGIGALVAVAVVVAAGLLVVAGWSPRSSSRSARRSWSPAASSPAWPGLAG
ncbi:hypothetical protein [Micromonospora sp. IBHARD004]|uniref:hypothetical protein n=1 Tax=Micromonospora sp. IBHARD004 TaxID=3457764 RepID=UPI00405A06C2